MRDWKKIWRIAAHIFFWACLFLLILYVNNARFSIQMALIQASVFMLIIIPLTYFNILYLIPRFFDKNKNKGIYIAYLAGILCLGATLIILIEEINLFKAFDNERVLIIFDKDGRRGADEPDRIFRRRLLPGDSLPRQFPREKGLTIIGLDSSGQKILTSPPDVFFNERGMPPSMGVRKIGGLINLRFSLMRWFIRFFQIAFIVFLSTIYSISLLVTRKDKEALALESEKFSSELKFLKSQINPHFLFNALNNIYTLSIIKSEKTPDVVMRLSEMLKYIIYETESRDHVPLQKEIAYIENFIAVFKLKDSRISKNVTFNYDVPEELSIAPMLLIPFIENAFKHSKIEDTEKGWIDIDLSYANSELVFSVKNSIPPARFEKDKIGGIGVTNVKRRLELIYPEKHELIVGEEENIHSVLMKILIENED